LPDEPRRPWWARSPEPAPAPKHAPPLADKAQDLEALRDAVVDAAGISRGLWVSYLFAQFYFLVAIGGVTHRQLLFESPVKLPFLNVDLPLTGFFWLGPALFIVLHAYVLLHFALLGDKVNAFGTELPNQIEDDDTRARLRRQLPVNIFVQFLAGPRDVREGWLGLLLWLIALITLVIGPVALLLFFLLRFLPYHSEPITWWQRFAVVIDLFLIWRLWPAIALRPEPPDTNPSRTLWVVLRRRYGRFAGWGLNSAALYLTFAIATFPGEWWEAQFAGFTIPLRQTLVAGSVDKVRREPTSLWSNRLVLPGLDALAGTRFDSEEKIDAIHEMVSFRGRRLEGAVLTDAVLRKADFTGAFLAGAKLASADLRGALFECDGPALNAECARLQGAQLDFAQLQGARLDFAQIEGARLDFAQLQGASLSSAQLQGALLNGAQLQGALLDGAQLQGASLSSTQLQGARFHAAYMKGASLDSVFAWRASLRLADTSGARIAEVRTGPVAGCDDNPKRQCNWTHETFSALRERVAREVPEGDFREEALKRLDRAFDPSKPLAGEDEMTKSWVALQSASLPDSDFEAGLARQLLEIGCAAYGAPYVLSGLIRQFTWRFVEYSARLGQLAADFLKPDCAGARGLSSSDRAALEELRDRAASAPAQPTAPAPPR
jgi:uncharacterized protein YjbI with pentapeptide repeats